MIVIFTRYLTYKSSNKLGPAPVNYLRYKKEEEKLLMVI